MLTSDLLEIQPLTNKPSCTVTVPGSKSITNRALILAALSNTKCELRGALWADDSRVMVESLQRLGFQIEIQPDPLEESNRIIEVAGREGVIPVSTAELYVGNAGTAARFLTALVSLGQGEYKIAGDLRMHERPMKDLFDGLRSLGVEILAKEDRLPAVIRSNGIHGDKITVSAKESSQFASALMLISRVGDLQVEIAETDEFHGYVEMTKRMMDVFQPEYEIEPDLSSASYFVGAGFLTGGDVQVHRWPTDTIQMDGKFSQFLPPPTTVSRLHDLGDSVMTLAICGLFGKQPMQIINASRMRAQECDRIHAMVTELRRVGARVEEFEDGLMVHPALSDQLHGAEIETYNDHRMAMAFAMLGLKVGGIKIKNPQCVAKTFPNYFDKLEKLRE